MIQHVQTGNCAPAAPERSRLRRIVAYLGAMLPVHTALLSGFLQFFAVYLGLQGLAGHASLSVSWRAWLGALSVTLILLLMRVYDELKDVESDLRFAAQGDPRYVNRPIVTGAVTVGDLQTLRWWITGLLVAVNFAMASRITALAFGLVFGVAWLSFKWFFWPAIAKNLLLALVTHNPIALLVHVYTASVFVCDFGSVGLDGTALLLLVAAWLPLAVWETARKIRAPEDETDYQTYSKMLGWRVAPWLPLGFGTTACLLLLPVAWQARLPAWFVPYLAGCAAVIALPCLRFRWWPSARTARLQPFAEVFLCAVLAGIVVATLSAHGMPVQG